MEIRKAELTHKDFNIFMKMHLKFKYAGASPEEAPRKPVIHNYEQYSDYAEKEWLYFAVKDGEEIGYAVIEAYEDQSVRISEIYVMEEHQRKRYGKEFVKCFSNFVKSEGFNKIEVFSANMQTDEFWSECYFRSKNGSEIYEYFIK